MNDVNQRLSELGSGFRTLLEGFLGTASGPRTEEEILSEVRDYRRIKFGREIRSARLYTELSITGQKFSFEVLGARNG